MTLLLDSREDHAEAIPLVGAQGDFRLGHPVDKHHVALQERERGYRYNVVERVTLPV
jgi:hypothetical protein